jgi:hypothetical protein
MSTAQIIYGEAVRAIGQQLRQLEELRTRASYLLTGNGLISAFLGIRALKDGTGGLAVFAIIAFAVSAAGAVWVMLPRSKGWTFENDATVLIEDHLEVESRNHPDALHRFLAERIQTHWNDNQENLEALFVVFWVATLALGAEIILWLLELAV